MNRIQLAFYETFILALVALCVIMIFTLSSQDGAESSSLSYEVTDVVVRLVDPDKEIDRADEWYQTSNGIIRQCAHAAEYALLGFLIIAALAPFKFGIWKKVLLCVALCAMCSVTDEWNQSFVFGRGSELQDVLTDIGGSFAGCACALILRKILLLAADKGAFWRMKE